MRSCGRFVLTLGLVVLLAGPAFAQQRQRNQQRQGGFGNRGGGGYGELLTNESVQKELKIEGDATAKVKEAVTKVREKNADALAKLRDLPMEEQRAKRQELTKAINEETLAAVNDVLKPEQVKRLKQIELQQAGYQAFARAEVEKALSLKDEQKEKIKSITEAAQKQQRELLPRGPGAGGGGGAGGFAANAEKLTALRKKTMEEVTALLTDDQKSSWKDLTGAPFELQRARRPDA
jgi:hypothetical protein